jgi:hypothetical protein
LPYLLEIWPIDNIARADKTRLRASTHDIGKRCDKSERIFLQMISSQGHKEELVS